MWTLQMPSTPSPEKSSSKNFTQQVLNYFNFCPLFNPFILAITPFWEIFLSSIIWWTCVKTIHSSSFFFHSPTFVHYDVLWRYFLVFFIDNTHIIGLTFIVRFAIEHFVFQLTSMGFVVQPCKCLAWLSFDLPFGFSPPIDFCCLSNIIKILGIPIRFISFTFFCFARHIGQRCSPCRCTSKVRGCPNNFWDPFLMFHPNNLFVSFSPSINDLWTLTCYFWHDPHEGLWDIHGSSFLDCP